MSGLKGGSVHFACRFRFRDVDAEHMGGLIEECLQEAAHGLFVIYVVDPCDFSFEEAVVFLQLSGFLVGEMDLEVPVHVEHLVPQIGGIRKDILCEFRRATAYIPFEIGTHHHMRDHFVGSTECDVVFFYGIRSVVHFDLETSVGTEEQDAPALFFVESDEISDILEYDEVFR